MHNDVHNLEIYEVYEEPQSQDEKCSNISQPTQRRQVSGEIYFQRSVQSLVNNSILLTGLEPNCTMWNFHLSVELTPYSIFFENCMQQFVLLMCWR